MIRTHQLRERKSRQVLAVSLSVLLLAGCAGTSKDTAGQPWASEIETAQKRATSEFEKEALSDGIVTASEKDEAHQRWVKCMTDRGQKATIELDDAGNEVFVTESETPEDSEQADIDNALCAEGTVKTIPGLYKAMQQNPTNRDFNELYAECLVRHEVVEPPFTGKDFSEAMAAAENGTPWNIQDPVFRQCMSSPEQ